MEKFERECYPQPLKLTNDDNDHFLECEVLDQDGLVHFKQWNKNKGLNRQLFYKGKDFYSVGPIKQKRATISGAFTRINRNSCSTTELWREAVLEKVHEYTTIGYPKEMVIELANATTQDVFKI